MGALSRRLEVEESCLAYETEGSMKAGAVQETQQSRDHGQKAAERRELARLAGPKWSSHDCERQGSTLVVFGTIRCCVGWQNPVVGSDAPDPGVSLIEGVYFAVTTADTPSKAPTKTAAGGAFDLRSSADLVEWNELGSVFTEATLPRWSRPGRYWAPEIHQVSTGATNVYFTASNTSNFLSIGVATADSPVGPFVDSGAALVVDDIGAIDATFHRDSDTGKQWLLWKTDGNSQGEPCYIKLRELRADGLRFAEASAEVVVLKNDQPWEGSVLEAPWIHRRGSEYYMFFSGGGFAGLDYAVGVARAPALEGPWVKAAAPVMTQVAGDPSGTVRSWAGPGHCSVVSVGTSKVTAMVYHSWRSTGVNNTALGRLMLMDQVFWGAKDGWPAVGPSHSQTMIFGR